MEFRSTAAIAAILNLIGSQATKWGSVARLTFIDRAAKLVSQALQFGYWSVIWPVGQSISQPGTHLDLQSDD